MANYNSEIGYASEWKSHHKHVYSERDSKQVLARSASIVHFNYCIKLCVCERACVKLYNRVSSTKPLDMLVLKYDNDDKLVTLFSAPDSIDDVTRHNVRCNSTYGCTGGPPYSRVIRCKTYRGYVKPRIIPHAIYNVIFV